MSLKKSNNGLNEKLITTATPSEEALARNTTFGATNTNNNNEFTRKSTFSRAYTFGTAQLTNLNNAITTPLEGLSRTLTDFGNKIDPDAQFTRSVIKEYSKHSQDLREGDVPLPTGFARKRIFWKLILLNGVVAACMGFVGAAFMNIADEVPKQWATCDYAGDVSCGDWYNGEKYFILIPSAAGLIVGLLRWGFAFPDNLPGIFQEIQSCHVHWEWSPLTLIISAVSLGGGASLGPEAGLGNAGGGLGTFAAQFFGKFEAPDEDYNELMVLSGMAAALGALFPSPLLSSMMIHELGNPPRTYMESTMIMSISACIAFAVYYEMVGVTYLEYVSPDSIELSVIWEFQAGGYKDWMWMSGVYIGIVSAALCLVVLLFVGIMKQVFNRMRERVKWSPLLKECLPPFIGGLLIGTVNWALPGTVGNGSITTHWVINFGRSGEISQRLLMCTGFARAFLLAISMNCGYIGGFIFPFLSMGAIAGVICYQQFPQIPLGMALGTFMFSIPCGIVPLPFTFTCLSCFIFFFGVYETVPIFISILVSYLLVCGSGLFKKLGSQAQKKNNAQTPQEVEEEKKREKDREEAEQFALKQYLGNKQGSHKS